MKKQIITNWDSPSEIKKTISLLQARLLEITPVTDKSLKKDKKSSETFNACMSIYNTNITDIYEDIEDDKNQLYYVYAHCDPMFGLRAGVNGKITFAATLGLNYQPFYIGKGTGNRAYDLNRNESHRKIRQKIEMMQKSIDVKIIKDGLTKIEALSIESKLIDIFGIKSLGGWLINLDEGHNSQIRQLIYKEDLLKINKMLRAIITN
jgi:hypothetical protein